MAIGRYADYVTELGSGKATALECSAEGVMTGSLITFPIIKSSQLIDTTDQTEKVDEGGDKYTPDANRTVKFNCTFMQQDIDTLKMMVKTYRGKYMTILKEIRKTTIDSNNDYLVMGICKVVPNLDMSAPGGEVKAEWNIQVNATTLTVACASLNDGMYSKTVDTSVDIESSGYWAMFQET